MGIKSSRSLSCKLIIIATIIIISVRGKKSWIKAFKKFIFLTNDFPSLSQHRKFKSHVNLTLLSEHTPNKLKPNKWTECVPFREKYQTLHPCECVMMRYFHRFLFPSFYPEIIINQNCLWLSMRKCLHSWKCVRNAEEISLNILQKIKIFFFCGNGGSVGDDDEH